uniref:Uncharacterized protein n=1 Tax=Neobodo designis TaxID=312471 RepID=A0A7S1MFZ4_NEODS|mmetsp:Transcript_39910/g.123326  ORF Transcript_39910/g.123326 Transcript_39910/m.123326 type:complete len:160 (+) Transcript_39910:31-510(+)
MSGEAADHQAAAAPQPAPKPTLRELMEGQRGELGDAIVSSRDYLELAKPIVAANGDRPPSRPSTAASPTRSVASPSKAAAAADDAATAALVASSTEADDERLVGEYRPQPPNRHLHTRDTLLLALRVLEVSKRDGFALSPEEQDLVNSIAAFATPNAAR